MAIAWAMVPPLPARGESAGGVVFHHLYMKLVEALRENHKTAANPSPTPPKLTPVQMQALQHAAATIEKLPSDQARQMEQKFAVDAANAVTAEQKPEPVAPALTSQQRAALQELIKSLETERAPNETSPRSK